MWAFLARIILRYRVFWLLLLMGLTAFMGYKTSDLQLSYDFAQLIPADHPKYKEYKNIRNKFGKDDNKLILGVQSTRLFEKYFYRDWHQLGNRIQNIDGITDVISVAHLDLLSKSDTGRQLVLDPLINEAPKRQSTIDSLKDKFFSLPFYHRLLYNDSTHATLMAVTFDEQVLDSKKRLGIVDRIKKIAKKFSLIHNTEVHYSGLPFIRTVIARKVREELKLFILLAMVVTSIILFVLFRSFYMVIAPMIVVVFSIVWSLGIMALLEYKVTILTGIIPPLLVVIAIPDCIYLLNRYHSEFRKHGNKIKALNRVIEKVGMATFITNLTTAIGFGVFFFTGSQILNEFGLVAFLNIMATFFIAIIFIPGVFSFLPNPGRPQTQYLENRFMVGWINLITRWIRHYRPVIYTMATVLILAAIVGMMRVDATGHIVDDIPNDTKEYNDLKFFEKHFSGVMPFEIVVNTGKAGRATQLSTIKEINEIQEVLKDFPQFSPPISIAEGLKYVTQTYYNGNSDRYQIPQGMETNFIMPYLSNMDTKKGLTTNLVDSSRQITKINLRMQDVGSAKLPLILDDIKNRVNKKVDTSRYDISYTGTSIIFLEGNQYLVHSLIYSLAIAFLLIAFIMGFLFRSVKMLFICLVPNVIPLVLTAGIMGYFQIPLKPSTVLIFSVAFGIAVDTSIHFLAKYQQEIHRHNWEISKTVSVALEETGKSMIYNSLILFFGFIIFSFSSFGGTRALGVLTSITLVVAMFTNTVLLPAFLLSLEWYKNNNSSTSRLSLTSSNTSAAYNNQSDDSDKKGSTRKDKTTSQS